MVKKFSLLSLALTFLALPVIAFAQTTTTNTVREKRIEARDDLRNQITQARDDFKAKLAEIKDARKKAIVENIDTKIKTINENRTQEMLRHLDRLTIILAKVSSKEAALKSQGKDTTALLNSISLAKTAIESARTAVNAQALKTYTATITTDETLKTAITTLLTQFKLDIKTTHQLVVAAQKAVSAAHKAAGLTVATLTPSITPTP